MSKKRTVQLLLIDGTATGRIQARLDNWTGIAYKIPKILLPESGDREELKFCGIYFLLGHSDENLKAEICTSSELCSQGTCGG